MGYYGAGDYYGAGGLGSFLKGAVGTVARALVPAPVRAVATGAAALVRPPTQSAPVINVPFGGAPGAGIGRIGTPAHVATLGSRRYYTKDGRPRRIRRDGKPYDIPSMNPGNTKALNRASKRIDRFLGVARGALKHTNYKVVSKSAGKGKKKR